MNWNTQHRLLALLLLLGASLLAPACSCSGGNDDDDDDDTVVTDDCDECEILVSGECVPDPVCGTCDLATLECDWCQTVNPAQCRCEGPAECVCNLVCPECEEPQYVETEGCQCEPKPGSLCGNGVVDFGELCDPPGSAVPNGGCGECCAALVCQQPCFEFNAASGRCVYKVAPPECPDTSPVCGDGVKEGSECCDDENSDPCDGCLPTCACTGTPPDSCPCTITSCAPGFELANPDSALCECMPKTCGELVCDPPYVINASNCTCLCALECTAPQVADGACGACICPNTCPSGEALDTATCACNPKECTNTCGANEVYDQDCNCICDVNSLACPAGFLADSTTCSCVCQPDQVSCPSPFYADPDTCQCTCGLACGTPKVPDGQCQQCVCPISCELPLVLDSSTCDCVNGDICTGLSCTPPRSVDAANCTCQCDSALLQCLPPNAADLTACACVCDPTQVTCTSPYGLNTSLCACECQRTCALGTRLDVASCTCVPTDCGNGVVETGEACDDGANNGRGPAFCAAIPDCCNPGWCNTNCSAVIICSQCNAFSVPLGNGDYTIPECNQ